LCGERTSSAAQLQLHPPHHHHVIGHIINHPLLSPS
jgi:hypothetical protein